MNKDFRYAVVRVLLKEKEIKTFPDIFKHIPMSVVAKDLHTNNIRFKEMINEKPGKFDIDDILTIARLIKYDERELFSLIVKYRNSL